MPKKKKTSRTPGSASATTGPTAGPNGVNIVKQYVLLATQAKGQANEVYQDRARAVDDKCTRAIDLWQRAASLSRAVVVGDGDGCGGGVCGCDVSGGSRCAACGFGA